MLICPETGTDTERVREGASVLSGGGGGIALSLRVKGQNVIKRSKLSRFHHLPSGADKVPEHRRKKVRSLGELMDWHARMSSSAGASLQGIGAHNGKGWEISNLDLAGKDTKTPQPTPRTQSCGVQTPRYSVGNVGSRLTTPRDQDVAAPRAPQDTAATSASIQNSTSSLPPRPAGGGVVGETRNESGPACPKRRDTVKNSI